MFQLGGIKVIVFYCVAGAVNHEVAECRNLFQRCNLYVHRQGRREAVQVKFLRRFTFRFQEKLVLFLVGEGYDFGFYTGAIAGPYTLNLPVEKGRIRQPFTKDAVCFLIGEAGPARQLLQVAYAVVHKGEFMEVVFSFLNLHIFVMHAPSVDAYGGSRFHSSVCDAVPGDGFGQLVRCGFCHAPARKHGAPYVHQSVQESSGSQYDAFGAEGHSPNGGESGYLAVFNEDFLYGVLPDVQVGNILQNLAPCPDEFVAVALCARTPHGGAFGAVQYAELDSRFIGYQSHISA